MNARTAIAMCLLLASTLGTASRATDINSGPATPRLHAYDVISDLAPGILNETAAGLTSADKTTTTVGATSVTLPARASKPVVLTHGPSRTELLVDLPDAAAHSIRDGITTFDVGAWAVSFQPLDEGDAAGVRTLFTLKDRSAPKSFKMNVSLPAGQRMVKAADGSVLVQDHTGKVAHVIPRPWAVDANSETIKTEYRVNGDTLIQDIFTTADTAFPVLADPAWKIVWGWVWTGGKWVWKAFWAWCSFNCG